MTLNANMLCEITEGVWGSVLGLEARCGGRGGESWGGAGEDEVATCVEITGAWEGSVTLCCPTGLAARVASIMFGLGDIEADDPDLVNDALCELANMIGGNLKGLLPGPSILSVPKVLGVGAGAARESLQVQLFQSFECHGERFCVAVAKAESPGGTA